MGDAGALTFRLVGGMKDVAAAEWDACAAPAGSVRNPFVTHAFLSALEDSGSATPQTGWGPRHLLVEDAEGRLIACAPAYLKSHSQGEYVFDYGWADAYERAGGRYYPKLQVCVPFSPVTGPRLLVRGGLDRGEMLPVLAAGLEAVAQQTGVSSLHVTFALEDEWRVLASAGFLQRADQQFHWKNRGYRDFDDFLASLASRKRKQIRKERERALSSGVEVQVVTGRALTEDHWDAFFAFYIDTGARKWGSPYLTRSFFSMLGERMADDVALVMCRRGGRWIAGALNLIGSDALYGRNWGAIEHHEFLHFEACYYQAMDFAIARGLSRVEAGAQGAHKLARGYLPAETHSAHWIADPGFRDAVARYLRGERNQVAAEMEYLSERSPFRRDMENL